MPDVATDKLAALDEMLALHSRAIREARAENDSRRVDENLVMCNHLLDKRLAADDRRVTAASCGS